jgi:hypothetical protein
VRAIQGGPGGAALLLVLVLFGGCHSRIPHDEQDWYAIGGPAAIPGVGVAAGIGRVFDRTEYSDWAIEAEGTYQFLDDTDFLDDGRGGSGDTYIVRLGVKRFLSPGHEHAFFLGGGVAWVRGTGDAGEALILEPPGDYYGVYGQVGFLTRLSPRWSAGPDFRLFIVGGHGVQFVPELTWQFVFRF